MVGSGALAGLAGVILASQFGAATDRGVAGNSSRSPRIVGTLLNGVGSVGATLAGALLLADGCSIS